MSVYIKIVIIVNLALFTYSQTYPFNCTPDMRGKICTMEYIGVCGLFNQNIQCIKAPCGQTFGNACSACSDERIASVTLGTCEGTNSNNSTILYPYTCTIADRSRTCNNIADSDVCAWYNPTIICKQPPCSSTQSNLCKACSIPNVEKIYSGKCEREMVMLNSKYIKSYAFILILTIISLM